MHANWNWGMFVHPLKCGCVRKGAYMHLEFGCAFALTEVVGCSKGWGICTSNWGMSVHPLKECGCRKGCVCAPLRWVYQYTFCLGVYPEGAFYGTSLYIPVGVSTTPFFSECCQLSCKIKLLYQSFARLRRCVWT